MVSAGRKRQSRIVATEIGVDAEIVALPWYNAATTYGVLIWYICMGICSAFFYVWSIAHAVFTWIMFVSLLVEYVFYCFNPQRFPINAFHMVKQFSVAVASLLMLLIRWRIGVFGDGDDSANGIGIGHVGIVYTDHMDLPLPYNNASWIAIVVFLEVNIAEAVYFEFMQRRGCANPMLGIGLLVVTPFLWSWQHMSFAWIIAYTLWNAVYILRRVGVRTGIVSLGHLFIPLFGTMLFGIQDYWIYLRAPALGLTLSFYYFGVVWLPTTTRDWRERWIHDCPQNDKEVLPNPITMSFVCMGWVCVILCWIPGLSLY